MPRKSRAMVLGSILMNSQMDSVLFSLVSSLLLSLCDFNLQHFRQHSRKCFTSLSPYIQSLSQPPPSIQQGLPTNGISSCYCRLCYWPEDSFVYLRFSENRTGAEKWSTRIQQNDCMMLQPILVFILHRE